MKLPFQLPFKKKDDKEYYLSLLLSDEKTHATIFSPKDGSIQVIGEKETHFSTPLEKLTDEQLLDTLDKTISAAESSLPDGYQTRKTIFGVKENWIDDTKIKKEYLAKLKSLCDALGLAPIGFLVIHEAVAHLLQKEEGAPVSAILAEVGTEEVAISVLRAGKLLETKRVPIGESIAKTIDKALLHFTSYEILPSRIIVLGGKHHEKLSQELISHQWSKSLPFLHVPQTKILPNTFEAKSLLFGAASQMGFDVVDKYDMPTVTQHSAITHETGITSEDENTTIGEKAAEENFGFIEEKDVAEGKKSTEDGEDTPETIEDEDETVENFNQEFYDQEHEGEEKKHTQSSKILKQFSHTALLIKRHVLAWTKSLPLHKLTNRFPMLSKNKGLIFIPPAVIGLLLILFLYYIFGVKATVVLHIDPKTVEKSQDVTFSTKESTDTSKNLIAAETVSTTESGNAQTATTGKKEVGDKAKGSVTIYSRLSESKTFSGGTVISGPNGLKFTLDKDVSVASSSGDASSSPSTATVSVTASDIGKESNLPSGSKFTIAGFSEGDAVAKNSDAFSGGSKQDITVVAKADQAKLLDSLPKQLEEKAKTDIASKVNTDKALLPVFLLTTVEKKSFDKNVGDEASTVSLSATVSYDSAAYTKSEVDAYAFGLLSQDNKELTPSKDSVSYNVSDISEKNGDIQATLQIKGYLLPKIDKKVITDKIAGKSFSDAQTIIKNTPQVKDAEIQLHPGLPFFPSFLPRISNNITVEITTNG